MSATRTQARSRSRPSPSCWGPDVIGQAQTGTGKTAAFGLPMIQFVDPDDTRSRRSSSPRPASSASRSPRRCAPTARARASSRRRLRRGADPHPAGAAQGGRPDRGRHRRPRARPDLAAIRCCCTRAATSCSTRPTRCSTSASSRTSRRSSRCARRPPDRAVLRDDAARDPRARRPPPLRPRDRQGQGRDADHRHRRAVLRRGGAREKNDMLVSVLEAEQPDQAIVFVRTKIRCDQLYRTLRDRGINVKALHGDMSQGSRDGVMLSFKSGRAADPRRHRRRGPRARHLLGHPHRQLRRADLARRLRPPHRAHRPRRALGPRDHVRRAAPEARAGSDREERQHDDRAVDRGRPRRARAAPIERPAPPLQAARRRARRPTATAPTRS